MSSKPFRIKNHFSPGSRYLGNYTPNDGTVEFYLRIHSLLERNFIVLNLGAGRGSWFQSDKSETRRFLHDIKPHVSRYIGVDIDPAVLENKTTTFNCVMSSNLIPLETNSIDLIVCDWVLEHVIDPTGFSSEVNRVLKKGGYFCARTPHILNYVSIAASAIKNSSHVSFLSKIQPKRHEVDVFPTAYKMNTLKAIKSFFPFYVDYSYLFVVDPAYYFGSQYLFHIFEFCHKRLLPKPFASCIMVFAQK
jgi:SAM-dependent methyltransferase